MKKNIFILLLLAVIFPVSKANGNISTSTYHNYFQPLLTAHNWSCTQDIDLSDNKNKMYLHLKAIRNFSSDKNQSKRGVNIDSGKYDNMFKFDFNYNNNKKFSFIVSTKGRWELNKISPHPENPKFYIKRYPKKGYEFIQANGIPVEYAKELASEILSDDKPYNMILTFDDISGHSMKSPFSEKYIMSVEAEKLTITDPDFPDYIENCKP